MPELLKLFAVCPRGLEAALAQELVALGASNVLPAAGGVSCDGDTAIAYAANLHSRLASRILQQVNTGRYRDDDDIYKIAARTEWEQWFDAQGTLRVDLNATRSPLRSLNFATLRVKDGIVDRLREKLGARPSIDTEQPNFRVFAYLTERSVTLYIDLSGASLFKRGWRASADAKGAAPLKENLAAGLLRLAAWQPGTTLYDPFCGSGTIVIEAAQQAAGIAPGSQRSFGFERLRIFDRDCWHALREQAAKRVSAAKVQQIFASDIEPDVVRTAQINLVRAGLPENAVKFSVQPAQRAPSPAIDGDGNGLGDAATCAGVIVTNPPYGERMDFQRDGSTSDFAALGAHWKQHYAGWLINVISSDRSLPAALGLKERRKTPVFNGAIECRLFHFEVFARR